ncbi:hypothetical protein BDC45DRAFT_534906 [Circinella umbellata]|nr:hypothetical protein BDC45DRAFT_534906 [Circinella umbellata]
MFPPSVMAPPSVPTRKRTHLKPSQVAVLQESFVTNPLPDASIRCRLARELGVTERTIQIWFQNRRAKARKLEATSNCPSGKIPSLMPNVRTGWIEPPPRNNNTPQRYQATFRTMMTPERFEEMQQQQQQNQQQTNNHGMLENNMQAWQQHQQKRSRSYSKPETMGHLEQQDDTISRAMSEGTDRMIPKQGPNNVTATTFPVAALRVGSWARFAGLNDQQWDLVCYAQQRQLIWQIQDDGHQFRIQIDFSAVQQLVLTSEVQEDMTVADHIQVHLHHPGDLTFSMLRAGIDQDWIRCGDFSENKQATYQGIHVLQGNHDMLRQALLQLINQAPDMLAKCSMTTMDVPALDLCRDFTLSPSATPEPAMTVTTSAAAVAAYTATHNVPPAGNNWMVQETHQPSSYLQTANSKAMDQNAWLQQQTWDNSWLQPHQAQSFAPSSLDVNFL